MTLLVKFFQEVEFAHPQWLFLLLVIPIMAGWYVSRTRLQSPTLLVSALHGFDAPISWKRSLRHVLPVFRIFVVASLIFALARPQSHLDLQRAEGEGIDIILCLDVSGSMLAQDFMPNRLEAAKQVAADFVTGRPTDRFGLVVFAGESFTQCPLTTDHAVLREQVYAVRGGFMVDGTAIGSGLASSLDRLRGSQSKSKVVILLTDGENNGGLVDPVTAKEMARTLAIKVYTIGVGSDGFAPTPVQKPGGEIVMQQEKVNLDEDLLGQIAKETGGRYFRAKDADGLKTIYGEIDRLEKSKVEIIGSRQYTERFHPFLIAAILFLFLEWVLRLAVFRKLP